MQVRALIWVTIVCALASPARAATLTYRGCAEVPDAARHGLRGMSGITYAGGDRYLVALDNSNHVGRLTIRLEGDGSIVSIESGRAYVLPQKRDFEGIATSPGGDRVYLSHESPAGIDEFRLPEMKKVRSLPVPEIFLKHAVPNQSFESLTLCPDGRTLWTANERALVIDGNPQTAATPILAVTRVRLLRYEIADDGEATPREQYEYETSGVHDWGGQIGLCDLVALPDGRLLALERSGAMNFQRVASIRTRIFLVDVAGATDVSQPPFDEGLVDRTPVKAAKTLLFDGFVCGERGQNLEGLCLGPELGENRWTVIGVVDDGDGPLQLSRTSVVAFELDLSNAAPRDGAAASPLHNQS